MVTSTQIGNNGRFGNQLFQIATTIGYGLENNTDILLPEWTCILSNENFGKHFPNYKSTNINDVDVKNTYSEPSYNYNKIPKIEDVNLRGYFQSYKYFEKYRDEIVNTLKSNIVGFDKDNDLISLHIRRGDYKTHSSSHVNLSSEYYKKCYDYYGENKTYLIFSDADIDEAFSIVPFIKNKEYMSKNKEYSNIYPGSDKNVVVDFVNMSSCSKHIIANSSLSWWAAWLSDGDVCAPEEWFTKSYGQYIGYIKNDLIPETWKTI